MTGDSSKESLKQLLAKRKDTITKKWFASILEAYPAQTKQFLHTNSNQFTNPVGHTYQSNLNHLFDLLLSLDTMVVSSEILHCLDEIIRIRAVQGFSPSSAMSFVFDLKEIVLQEALSTVDTKELFDFCSALDAIALKGFEIYMQCRETLYEIRVKEFERNHYRLLQMANLICNQQNN